MTEKITRRNFLKQSCCVGTTSLLSAGLISEFFSCKTVEDFNSDPVPLCQVKKEIYIPSPEPGVATVVSMTYVGEGLRREEERSLIRSSDWTDNLQRRISVDNGRNWSDWDLIHKQWPKQGDFTQSLGPSQRGTGPYDPLSGRLIKPVFQRLVKGDPKVAMKVLWKGNRLFSDHGFYQLSKDNGHTWEKAKLLKYEDGPGFDPDYWGDPRYFRTNEMYIGKAGVLSNGTIVISATIPVEYRDEEDEKIKSVFPNTYREGHVAGAVCFVGRWNESDQDYKWMLSKPIFLPRQKSSRGLVELDISELKNGNLLLLMRGSNTGLDINECPGRKWFSLSRDGGLSWSDVKDIRYDTGEQLYSPASISKTIRSSKTGKLYWIGNIPDRPPNGNSPRYPLQIVEIDENGPSFKKSTVTVIDNRDPQRDSEHLQLSNFSLLENRETHEMELYLTRLGELGGGPELWTADAYKYTLVF